VCEGRVPVAALATRGTGVTIAAHLLVRVVALAGPPGRRRGEPFEALQQVASVGLIQAVDRFDPGREVDFLSFAVPTITGEVLRHFRDRVHTVRVPRRLRELQSRIYDAAAELAQRHGRAARPSEIGRHLELDVEIVLEALVSCAKEACDKW